MKDNKKLNLTPIEDLISEDFGKFGTLERDAFEMACGAFIIGEQLKDERLKVGLTQEELAKKSAQRKALSPALRKERLTFSCQRW